MKTIQPKTLKLASNLVLPISVVTDTWAWFGTRGTGKTFAAGATLEALYDAGAQFVYIDPVGVGYGLRLAANGRGRGLDIPVFGGLHADVPLEPTGGELVAQLVVDQGVSVVLDVSMMTLGQQHRFVLAFATSLFNLKKSKRTPMFVLFDEAHEFMPQQPGPNEAEMLGAVRRLWKMGRNFGIGVGLISQRPAEVNKGVVNLTERMFCGRFKGPHDRKAMLDWAKDQEADISVLDEMPRLPPGELMHWTDKGPIRVRFFPKKTFDASKTPEQGDVVATSALPKIDLGAVRTAMAATIEEAKANDPKALRARIAELERQAARPPAAGAEVIKTVRVIPAAILEIGTRTSAARLTAQSSIVELEKALGTIDAALVYLTRAAGEASRAIVDASRRPPDWTETTNDTFVANQAERASRGPVAITAPLRAPGSVPSRGAGDGAYPVTKGARAILTALAQHADGLTRRKLGILSGYAPGGTSMREALALCRKTDLDSGKAPWVEDSNDGTISINEAGRLRLGVYAPLPSGEQLRDHWIRELDKSAARILRAVCDAHPNGLTKEGISEATARDGGGTTYAAGGTSMREALATLRGLEIVDDVGDRVVAAEALF